MDKQDIVGAIVVAIIIIMASQVHATREKAEENGRVSPDTNINNAIAPE